MTIHETPGLGAEFQDTQSRSIIDIHLALHEGSGSRGQIVGIPLAQKAVPHALKVHPRARTEQSLDQLRRAHFQTEDADRNIAIHRHMLGDIHGEGGLTHRGTCGDDDHLARVQSAGHFVELLVTGGQPRDLPLVLVKLLDRLNGIIHMCPDLLHILPDTHLAYGENLFFHIVYE